MISLLAVLLLFGGMALSTGGIEQGVLPWLAVAAAAIPLVGRAPTRSTAMVWGGATVLVALTWYFLTSLPFSPRVAIILGEPRLEWFNTANVFLHDLATAGLTTQAVVAPPRFSLSSLGTLRFVLLGIVAFAGCWATVGLSTRNRWRLLVGLVTGGTLMLMIGLIRRSAAVSGVMLFDWPWLFSWFDSYASSGSYWPFINRNHFASCCAMVAMGSLALAAIPRPGQLSAARRVLPRMVAGLAYMLLGLAIFLTESRGGMLAFLTGSLVVTILFLRHHRRGGATTAVVLAVFTVAAALALPSDAVQRRLNSLRQPFADGSFNVRVGNWHDSVALWRAFPVVGSGMESFRSVFPAFRQTPGRALPFFAENEAVQLLTDSGILGLTFVALVGGAWMVAVWGNGRHAGRTRSGTHRDHTAVGADTDDAARAHALRIAAIGVFTVVAVHCLTDFPLRIPLNATLAGCLLAMGLPVADGAISPTQEVPAPLKIGPLVCRLSMATLFLCLAIVTAMRFAPLPQPDPAANDWSQLSWEELQQALALVPADTGLWREFGARLRVPDQDAPAPPAGQSPPRSSNTLSLVAYRQAVARNPADPALWMLVAKLEFSSGNPGLGAQALERAVTLQPSLANQARALMKEVWKNP